MFSTDRVRLRPQTPDDAELDHQIWSDPDTYLIVSDAPFVPKSLEAVKAKIEKETTEPDSGAKFVAFVVETTADATALGTCALFGMDNFNGYAQLGIVLLPASRGHGYGRDALSLLCLYGFRMRNLRRIELSTFATNRGMRKTAEACGFVHEGTQRQRSYNGEGYGDIAIYGLLRGEWNDGGQKPA